MKKTLTWLGVVTLSLFVVYQAWSADSDVIIERYNKPASTTAAYILDGAGNQYNAGWNFTAGSMTVSGITGMTGALTTNGGLSNPLTTAFTSTLYRVIATSIVPVNVTYVNLVSTGGNLNMTALPTLATATVAMGGSTSISDGSFLILGSTMTAPAAEFRLNSDASLSGTKLILAPSGAGFNTSTEVITSSRTATFVYSAATGFWIQTSPNNGVD